MSEDQPSDLESSIVPTIAGDLAPVAQDLAELAIDSVLDDGLLRDVPVIGALVGLWNAQRSVRDRLYLTKMLKFFGPLSKAPLEARRNFVETTLNSDRKKQKFSEAVVHLVERADSSEKTELYGRFFLAHIQGQYEYEHVLKICSMIDRSFLPDLRHLRDFVIAEAEDNLLTGELYKNGFLSLVGLDGGTFTHIADGGAVYGINWYGEQVALMLQELDSDEGGT